MSRRVLGLAALSLSGVISCSGVWAGTGAGAAAPSDPELVRAVERGDRDTAVKLIRSHADVRQKDVDGTTALAWAAHRGDVELAGMLIAAGADVHAANDYGASPMSAAAENGDAAMLNAEGGLVSTPCDDTEIAPNPSVFGRRWY